MKNSDHAKEKVLRRLLALRATKTGFLDDAFFEIVDRLANLLARRGDIRGSIALRTQYALVNLDSPAAAVHLNSLAMDWRRAGRPCEAELLLRQAHEIETRVLPSDSETHPHRLNNLSTVLIMQGKLDEAVKLLRRAWELMEGRHDTTSVRILLSRLTISLLESRPPGIHIGRLKTLFRDVPPGVAGIITPKTTAAVKVDYLVKQLSRENFELLHALYRVANAEAEVDELERFRLWRKYPPIELHVSI
jgi:tetratricopeptide (TPR) repeat protein